MSAPVPRNLRIVALSLSLLPGGGCGRAVHRSPESSSPTDSRPNRNLRQPTGSPRSSDLIGTWKGVEPGMDDVVLQLDGDARFHFTVAGIPLEGTWVEKGSVLELYTETAVGQDARESTRQTGPARETISPDRKRIIDHEP